jgi:N-acetylneuraminate synthase
MSAEFEIRGRAIGPGQPVYVVAELSGNHNQSLELAVKTVEAACRAGVDAIKLQTYTPDTLTIDCANKWFRVGGTNREWRGQTLYELYGRAYTPWEWQPKLQQIAARHGVELFSSAFDESAVDFLESMHVPAYKVASFEIVDLELLRRIGATRKPVILSRGMASIEEIRLAIKTLTAAGTRAISVLHCVSSYPAKPEEMNLATIPALRKALGRVIGLSDHTLGIDVAIASVALGASIVEKHVTLRRRAGGVDASFSLEPDELRRLVEAVRTVERSIGTVQFHAGSRESSNRIFRRSLFVVTDVVKGEPFTRHNVRVIRPGYGLAPKLLKTVLGRRAARAIRRGTPLRPEHLNGTGPGSGEPRRRRHPAVGYRDR